MRQRLEAALPLLVLVAFGVTAVLVNLLLTNARNEGIDALEDALQSEVEAIASTQEQRVSASLANIADAVDDAEERLELTPRSQVDHELIDAAVSEDAEAGIYVLGRDARITQGVLFTGDPIGQQFDWPGFPGLQGDEVEDGVVLPARPSGLTTDQPVYAFLFSVAAGDAVRGGVVIEQVVSFDSGINREIAVLERGETGRYLVFDSRGTVVAANNSSLLAQTVGVDRFLDVEPGVHRFDGAVVAIAEVPTASWRVAFQQDADEFEDALARPVQTVGQILVLVLLAAGVILTLLLNRRLRAARAEQQRLRELNEAQQELISIVSHELRTPVAGVLGFLETTLDHWDAMDDDERQRAIGRAAANARRLQAMTRDVLDTQTVEGGRLVHVLEPVDLAEEVRVAVAATEDLDPDRTFDVHLPDQAAWVQGDADRIQQVLANLLENARKNSPAVESIEVSVDVRDDTVELAVTDHGAGIEPESLERIFDKFVRGRDEGVTGTGLGLYISRQIVDAHGGRIWAESDAGTGATFRVLLPRATAPAHPEPEVVNP